MDNVHTLKGITGQGLPSNENLKSVHYVERKAVDYETIESLLSISSSLNHWSNFGPLSKQLETKLSQLLVLDKNLRVVACSSATCALHALAALHQTLSGHSMRWATSSFGFYSSADGPLNEANIVDCDKRGMLDLSLINPVDIDGLIVTNVFGQEHSLEKYRDFARQHNKALILDSAMAFQPGGHIANECISLHHTKPWGFGEGGCAIVHKDHETLFRDLISFGHSAPGLPINRLAINGKISDVACAFVLMRLNQMECLSPQYRQQYLRIGKIALDCEMNLLADAINHPGTPANVPILLPRALDDIEVGNFPLRRYYHPLANTPNATDIYKRIINIPCHPDMSVFSDDDIRKILLILLSRY